MLTAATPLALRQKYFLLGVWALLLGTGHSRASIKPRFDISSHHDPTIKGKQS
jgi:hypothetical protein